MIDKIKQQLKHIDELCRNYGYITLSEACHAVCCVNGIKYSYELAKGTTIVNIALEDIAKIMYVYEVVDKLYKQGKIKLEDLKQMDKIEYIGSGIILVVLVVCLYLVVVGGDVD